MNWKKRKKLSKLAKRHGLIHGYEYKRFIRKKVIRYKNRNGRRYSPEFVSAAISDFEKHRDQLIKEGKWRGEIDHPVPHVDVAQNPDVTTEARIGISPKGDVKFYGFDICKT